MSGWISSISILACGILFCIALAYWFSGSAKAGFYWLIPTCIALVIAVLSSYWHYVVKPAQGTTHTELSATERPYIGISGTEVFDLVVGEPASAVIEFKNTGNSPAYEFKVLGEVDIRWTPPALPEKPDYTDISKQQPPSVDTLNPTDTKRQVLALPAFTKSDIDALINKRATGYFYGRVFYKDAKGKQHLYLFCRYLDLGIDGKNPTLVSCGYHNGEVY